MRASLPTLASVLHERAAEDPAAPALLAPGRPSASYADVVAQAGRLGGALVAGGVTRTDSVAVVLPNGQERVVELKSAYREGVLHPIGVGGKAELKQHLDTSKALGVGCGDLKSRRVVRTICEAEGGRSCASSVSVKP